MAARSLRTSSGRPRRGPPAAAGADAHRDSAGVELPRLPAVVQAWLPGVLNQLPSGVLIVDSISRGVVFWNDRARRAWPSVLQVPASLARVNRCRLVGADERPSADDQWPIARAVSTGEPVEEELQVVADDGTRSVMDVRCVPFHDDAGDVVAVVAILHDITERRRVERALQASQARYENLYQDAPDMFASVTVDTGQIVQCNQTLERAVGFTRRELIGRSLHELHCPRCWPNLKDAMERVSRTGRVRDTELQLQCRTDHSLDVSLSMAAIRDEQGNLYYRSTWRDIAERKRAQAVLSRQQAELAQSRLELQGLAGRLLTAQEDERRRISRELHDDLNQRLAMLALEVETLCQQPPPSQAATVARLRTFHDGVIGLSDAVHDLAYRLHASVLDDLGLRAALRSYLADYQRRESIDVELKDTTLPETIPVNVASCLYRVAQEALRNVARHARATRVTVSLERSHEGVRMIIVDDGTGFDVARTESVGSSLGIVGMQERVRLVDGRFALVSRPGKGTHVDVWVPLP